MVRILVVVRFLLPIVRSESQCQFVVKFQAVTFLPVRQCQNSSSRTSESQQSDLSDSDQKPSSQNPQTEIRILAVRLVRQQLESQQLDSCLSASGQTSCQTVVSILAIRFLPVKQWSESQQLDLSDSDQKPSSQIRQTVIRILAVRLLPVRQ